MNDSITIITAFFDIGRKSWESYARSNEQYFQKFSEWSVLQNSIIVYVETEKDKERVLRIRSEQGRLEQTKVIVTGPFRKIDPELEARFHDVSLLDAQRSFHRMPANPESWNSDYNLIMLLKFWCVDDAVKRFTLTGQVAWVDFGFRPAGYKIQPKALWDYRFPSGMTVFSVAEYNKSMPLFQIIQSMDTFIMGTVVVADSSFWSVIWQKIREYALGLLRLGVMDDDQIFLLMMLEHNDWCEALPCPWGQVMSLYGGVSMAVTELNNSGQGKRTVLSNLKRRLKVYLTSIACGMRVVAYLAKDTKGD